MSRGLTPGATVQPTPDLSGKKFGCMSSLLSWKCFGIDLLVIRGTFRDGSACLQSGVKEQP